MNTGARRGEVCALRWMHVDDEAHVVDIKKAIGRDQHGNFVEKHTKTHQQRRVVIDEETLAVLKAHRVRCETRAKTLGIALRPDSYVFSDSPDGTSFLLPSTVSQRYERMATSLDIETNLHRLRHYSATELINAGVDLRAVAGRLGHGGGGATTLRVYAAWTTEADQRAASSLAGRMPQTPSTLLSTERPSRRQPLHIRAQNSPELDGVTPANETTGAVPYIRIAADLRAAITCGALRSGDSLPTHDELANRYEVANSTAHRAVSLLEEHGIVTVSRGRRAVVSETGPEATRTTFGATKEERDGFA